MSLTFVNMVPNSTIWVAYLYYNDGCSGSPFQKEGWYSAPYGGSTTVWNGDVAWLNRYYYFYAFTEGVTPQLFWTGPINVTVTNAAFNQCQWDNTNTTYTAGFQEIDVGINWDYTVTLTGPGGLPKGGGGGGGSWSGDGGGDTGDDGGGGWSGDDGDDGGDDG
jgi:uncharacterized membrane protein